MRQTFYGWMLREIESGKMALLGLYEKRDHLLYVEAPPLRKKYMALIGSAEEEVLQAELEAAMMRRKLELVQTAINRRETIDIEAVNKQLESEKQERLAELEKADLTLNELPQLSEQEERNMQRQYREITRLFHPALNTNLTDTEKELYEKAVEAYKMQDADAMSMIYEMLLHLADLGAFELDFSRSSKTSPQEIREQYSNIALELSTDYRLAKKLYSCFIPLEEDQVVLDVLKKYDEERKNAEKEIEQIRKGFPFNAVSTINDPRKTQEYLAELRIRRKYALEEKETLEQKVNKLLEVRKDAD